MREKIEKEGATVIVKGEAWDDANQAALSLVVEMNESGHSGSKAVLVHPFDHQLIWDGHASIIEEISEQLTESASSASSNGPIEIDAFICVVGGGGLLAGCLQGIEHQINQKSPLWHNCSIIAVETVGAASLHSSLQKNSLVTLPAITSIATTLGAKQVSKPLFEKASSLFQRTQKAQTNSGESLKLLSLLVSDEEAVNACLRFADDERILVEPSCGAGLAVLYEKRAELLATWDGKAKRGVVVVEVCGGSNVSLRQLKEWEELCCSSK